MACLTVESPGSNPTEKAHGKDTLVKHVAHELSASSWDECEAAAVRKLEAHVFPFGHTTCLKAETILSTHTVENQHVCITFFLVETMYIALYTQRYQSVVIFCFISHVSVRSRAEHPLLFNSYTHSHTEAPQLKVCGKQNRAPLRLLASAVWLTIVLPSQRAHRRWHHQDFWKIQKGNYRSHTLPLK